MTNSYINSLQERLRPVARLVFPSDPFICVCLSNTNKYTHLYLCRIIQLARSSPFNLTITNAQLARLFKIPLKKFLLWFQRNIYFAKVFRRVRHFLRDMIIAIIYEDRGELDILRDRNISQKSIGPPSKKTKAYWKQLTKAIREETQHQGPVIGSLAEAEELIEVMQEGYCSSDSSESDDESMECGQSPDDKRTMDGINSGMGNLRSIDDAIQLYVSSKKVIATSINSDDDDSSLSVKLAHV